MGDIFLLLRCYLYERGLSQVGVVRVVAADMRQQVGDSSTWCKVRSWLWKNGLTINSRTKKYYVLLSQARERCVSFAVVKM